MTVRAKAPNWLTARPFAHRGLHDGNRVVPENSLEAARLAIEQGLGIECDLQFSADGVPLVFHDDDRERLTGMRGDIRDLPAASATKLCLCGTGETVPTFAELLDFVGGRVPLLVELKGRNAAEDDGFVEAVGRDLESYDGPVALMSFADHLVAACRKKIAARPLGLTAEGRQQETIDTHRAIAADGIDFVSYNHNHLPNPFTDDLRAGGKAVLCWTIRTEEQARTALASCDQITFEGYLPDM